MTVTGVPLFGRHARATTGGSARSGIGAATKKRRTARASQRARRTERDTRALSVAMPVFAYICRYSFEINTKTSRARSDRTHDDRSQI